MANSHFSTSRFSNSGLNFRTMKALTVLIAISLFLCGCSGSSLNPIQPTPVSAATPTPTPTPSPTPLPDPSAQAVFCGTYIFESSGFFSPTQPFTETGSINVTPCNGTYTLDSWMNTYSATDGGQLIHSCGTYSLHFAPQGYIVGTAEQHNCDTGAPFDGIYLIVAADGSWAKMQNTRAGTTWKADLHRY